MGKISLATRLADEAGVSVQKARRFVDDVGAGKARQAADELATQGSRTIRSWAVPVGAAGGIVGGGALAWRQQDVAQARALAERSQSYEDAVGKLIESDLSPEAKRDMLDSASNAAGASSDAGGDDGGIVPDDPQTLIILVIVMAIVLKTALGGGR